MADRKPRLVVNAAVAGFFLYANLYGFIQDLAGKEAWMDYIDRDWINVPAWIWPPIMLVLIIYISRLARVENRLLKESKGHGDD
jgi:hypothetical protein